MRKYNIRLERWNFMEEVLHFGADINFLCHHFIQSRYEKLCEIYQDMNYKKTYLYPLWDEINKEDINYEDELQNFVQNTLQFKGEVFTLTPEIFQYFANYVIDNIFKKRKTYLNKVAVHEKANKIAKIKNDLAINHIEYYVLDKKTEKVYLTSFGSHFSAIIQILTKVFGEEFVNDEKNWPELDKYIEENLELGGNWHREESYALKNHQKDETFGHILNAKYDSNIQEYRGAYHV